jgi:hypothetical protein
MGWCSWHIETKGKGWMTLQIPVCACMTIAELGGVTEKAVMTQ